MFLSLGGSAGILSGFSKAQRTGPWRQLRAGRASTLRRRSSKEVVEGPHEVCLANRVCDDSR